MSDVTRFAWVAAALWVLGGVAVLLVGLVMIKARRGNVRRVAGQVGASNIAAFREMSIVAQIVAIMAVYGFFGVRYWGQRFTPVTATGVLIGMTTLMIIIGIVSHGAIRIWAGPEKPDERDLLVNLRGSRNAYRAMAAGAWCVLLLTIAQQPLGLLFYALMGAFALAELVRLGSQLFYYRFGV
jgi:hypothetical protein